MADFTNGQLSLLPEPPFAPRWPNPNTLPGQVLARLMAGERLTQPRFGLNRWRLSAYIMTLRYLGWPVQCADVPCPPDCGAGRPIREYWLTAETIMKAKAAARS